jgi:hypothetical protein
MLLHIHTNVDAIITGRLPNADMIGTLAWNQYIQNAVSFSRNPYHRRLLKPKTSMQTPVNWITSVREEWNSSIRSPNIGANASGPNPCEKVANKILKMDAVFHIPDQF